jgi:fused signal recognition particle receptor
MFSEEFKKIFNPLLEKANLLFSKFINKGVPISDEMTFLILAVFTGLLILFILALWIWLRSRSVNKKRPDEPSEPIKNKQLEQLNKERAKELDLRIKEEKRLQEEKQTAQLEKVQKREKAIKDQITTLEDQGQKKQILQRELIETPIPSEKPEQTDSFLDRLRAGVDKTRKHLLNNLSDAVLGKKEINDEVLDELEEVLIGSDIGPETTQRILEAITEKVEREELKNLLNLESGSPTKI